MSDFQIVDAINQADTSWNLPQSYAFPTDDLTGLDWFDWSYPTDFAF